MYVRLKPPADETGVDHANKKKRDSKRAWNLQKTGALDTLVQKGTARKVEGRTVFHFDQVFDEDAKTPLLYKSIARAMVHTVMDGKHATIFAYGQTGSGYVPYVLALLCSHSLLTFSPSNLTGKLSQCKEMERHKVDRQG